MKNKRLLNFALFITIAVLLSGCGKTDKKTASENASLKARAQKLEQQLKEANSRIASQASQGTQPASLPDLQRQLDEAQKKAEAAANDLQSANSQAETQKEVIISLTRQLSDCQQAGEKAGKALELYQDKAASALKEFKTLRSTLDGTNAMLDAYHQNYLATQTAVTNLVAALPESQVRRAILGVLATFACVDDAWETAALQMQARTKAAQAEYDKFVDFGGLGPNDYVVNLGKSGILAPAEQENAVTATMRDQQTVFSEKDMDLAIKNLQDLVSGQKI